MTEERQETNRVEMEKRAAGWMKIWALAHEDCPDSMFTDLQTHDDLYKVAEKLYGLPLDEDALYEARGAAQSEIPGSPFKRAGESEKRTLRAPKLCSRKQVNAAAGLLAEAFLLVSSLGRDYLLDFYGHEGPVPVEIEKLLSQFNDTLLAMGEVLGQEGDLLKIGEVEEARWFKPEDAEQVGLEVVAG